MSNNSITANFTGYTCQETTTYTAANPCSNDGLTCSILYISGDFKGADADAFDHGLMQYIDDINDNSILIGALAKNVSGQGLYDPNNTSTLTPYDIDTFSIILVSGTTWGDISSTLKTELKVHCINLAFVYLCHLKTGAGQGSLSTGFAAFVLKPNMLSMLLTIRSSS